MLPADAAAEATLRFGGNTPAVINDQLELAASHYYDDAVLAELILLQARDAAPQCLSVYFSLYKFYFYKQKLAQAEQTVLDSLQVAAELGEFTNDLETLTPTAAPWADVTHPAHFYLFSLKALAFIRLRLKRADESKQLLDKLAELDPQDQVGGSVIRELLQRSVT